MPLELLLLLLIRCFYFYGSLHTSAAAAVAVRQRQCCCCCCCKCRWLRQMEELCWDVMVTMAELISSSSLHQPTSVISASKTAAAAAYSLFVLSSFFVWFACSQLFFSRWAPFLGVLLCCCTAAPRLRWSRLAVLQPILSGLKVGEKDWERFFCWRYVPLTADDWEAN